MGKINEALAFQKKKSDTDMDVAETVELKAFKEDHRNAHHEGGATGGGDSDEEMGEDGHGHGGGGVQCQQQ